MSDPQIPEVKALAEEARAVARAAEEALRAREPARMIEALQGCDRMLKAFPAEKMNAETQAPDPADPLAAERMLLWFWRGRLLTLADKPDVVVQGLHSLDQALARLRLATEPRPVLRELATAAWLGRGLALLRLGSREALAESVRSHDQAIQLMEASEGADAGALGAAWMNRGAGLLHLDAQDETAESAAARMGEAAKSFERAAAVLEPAAETNPAARQNLASAWANLGVARTRQGDAAGAVVAHRRGVELIRGIVAESGAAAAQFDLAARVFNLGQALGAAGDTEASLAAARESMELAEGVHLGEPQVVELAMRARHAVCVALGARLAAGRAQAEDPDRAALLAEAGDLVEDGLAALKAQPALPEGVAEAGARLYEFGAWLYRTQQPWFLPEFLLEHLGEDGARARIASAAVAAARQDLMRRGFGDAPGGGVERTLAIMQGLGEVEERLKERASGAARV